MSKNQKILTILFFTLLLDMVGIGMLIPVIPSIFTDPESASFMLQAHSEQSQLLLAGLLTAVAGLMQFIAAPLLGELSDAFGRKKLLIVGVGFLAFSQLLFGVGVEFHLLWLLFVSRMIAGLAGANFSIAQAAIADITEPHNRARNFGLIGAAFGLGFILGPILSAWLIGLTGNVASPFWIAAALGMVNVISAALFLPETHLVRGALQHFHILKGVRNIQTAWRDKQARPVYLASFFTTSGFTFLTSFVSIFLVVALGFNEQDNGIFFAAIGGWMIFTQAVVLRFLAKKYTEKQVLRAMLPILALSVAVFPFVPSSVFVYLLIPFLAVPNGLITANMGSLISKSVSAGKQGAALGINGSLMALAQGVIPLVAGVGSGALSLNMPFLTGGTLIFIAWYILTRKI